jgi:hypothetical protein
MVDDVSVLLGVSPFGTKFLVNHPFTSVVTISQEELKSPLTLGGVLHTFA